MHVQLELLAPAKNAEIGIAAIDCGADAVYIAGPAFGARQAAGNSIGDLQKLCTYAHQYGARIFVTLNTILYDDSVVSFCCLSFAFCGGEKTAKSRIPMVMPSKSSRKLMAAATGIGICR